MLIMKRFIAVGCIALFATTSFAQQARSPQAAVTLPVQDANVSEVTVDAGAPVPKVGAGAPLYSVQDLEEARKKGLRVSSDARFEADRCRTTALGPLIDTGGPLTLGISLREEVDAGQRLATMADRAAKASGAATQARTAAAADPSAERIRASEQAELARQAAVNAFIRAREDLAEAKAQTLDLMDMMRGDENEPAEIKQANAGRYRSQAMARRADRAAYGGPEGILINADYADLTLTQVAASARTDRRGGYVEVSALIGNPRSTPVQVPALSITSLDPVGFKLATVVAEPDRRTTIPPGKKVAFTYNLRPAPKRTASVFMTFADGRRAAELPASYFCKGARGGFVR